MLQKWSLNWALLSPNLLMLCRWVWNTPRGFINDGISTDTFSIDVTHSSHWIRIERCVWSPLDIWFVELSPRSCSPLLEWTCSTYPRLSNFFLQNLSPRVYYYHDVLVLPWIFLLKHIFQTFYSIIQQTFFTHINQIALKALISCKIWSSLLK